MSHVQLRPATADDARMIFEWRNQPFVLQRSTSTVPISWGEHQSWYAKSIRNPNYRFYVVLVDGEPAGQVRFDRKGSVAIVSVFLVEQKTNHGFGVEALRQSTAEIFREWQVRKVVACIRTDNRAAQSAFTKAGYSPDNDVRSFCPADHVVYSEAGQHEGRSQAFWRSAVARVLVIAAHPDDEILGCGGTMARLVEEGHEVRIVILGEGITSRYQERAEADQSLLVNLHDHARRAALEVGVQQVEVLNLPDNRFDTVALLDVVKRVETLIEEYNPDVIFTHHESDLNVDHRVTFRAVLTATRPIEGHPVRDLYSFEIPSSTEWSFHAHSPAFQPNVFFDISTTLERKKRAMGCYETEIREFPHPRSLQALDIIARRWGTVVGCQAAEAFALVRSIRLA